MKNNPKSDLAKLVEEFEAVTLDLRSLDTSDSEERQLGIEARKKLNELDEEVSKILAGNERARRERMTKLANLQELLRPILFPMNECVNTSGISHDTVLDEFIKFNNRH